MRTSRVVPNDIEFSSERKRVRCNEGLGRPQPRPLREYGACEYEIKQKCHGPTDERAKLNLWNKLRFRMPVKAMARQDAGPTKKARGREYETGWMAAPDKVIDDGERQHSDDGGDDPGEVPTVR
jgi:hypothetical protein